MISDRKILRAPGPFIPVNRSRCLHGVDLTDFRRAFVNADKSRPRRSFYENVKRFYDNMKYSCRKLKIVFIKTMSRLQ